MLKTNKAIIFSFLILYTSCIEFKDIVGNKYIEEMSNKDDFTIKGIRIEDVNSNGNLIIRIKHNYELFTIDTFVKRDQFYYKKNEFILYKNGAKLKTSLKIKFCRSNKKVKAIIIYDKKQLVEKELIFLSKDIIDKNKLFNAYYSEDGF